MKLTKKELVAKAAEGDVKFFVDLYYNGNYNKTKQENPFKVVYDQNWGDGNDWFVALHFIEENINILLEGYYSSHGDSEFTDVSLAVPYEYTETRYKSVTQQDIRDMKLDEVIIEDKTN